MIYGVLGTTGVVWGAVYLLWMYQKVCYGPIRNQQNRGLPDLDGRERISLWPIAVLALIMGVASPYWMKSIDEAVANNARQTTNTAAITTTTADQNKPGGTK